MDLLFFCCYGPRCLIHLSCRYLYYDTTATNSILLLMARNRFCYFNIFSAFAACKGDSRALSRGKVCNSQGVLPFPPFSFSFYHLAVFRASPLRLVIGKFTSTYVLGAPSWVGSGGTVPPPSQSFFYRFFR